MKNKSLAPYVICIVLALVAGTMGSFFTLGNIVGWYDQLSRPFWTPPNWLFGPVWTSLYILMGISAGLVWKSDKKGKWSALTLYFLHLIVNGAWAIIFFGMHDLFAGLLTIKLLWILIVIMMIVFWRYSRLATYLLIPYLLWVTYASTLNLGIVLLN